MSKILEVYYENKPCYQIIIERGFLRLKNELAKLNIESRKVAIITDSRVSELYLKEVHEIISSLSPMAVSFVFPEGEENKHLGTVEEIYDFLIQHNFDRKDLLVALGGGVVGDMTGFIAATYLRGVDFVQIPTTLLAQLDSSIGGKTGVDVKQYKNMVGAFKMPSLVYMNTDVLHSLSDRQFSNGFAEAMKHGLIKDEKYYVWMISNMTEIMERDNKVLEELIYQSCQIKKAVVENDPLEKGERALLNFGHTLGHAIEKYKNFTLLHGECVALGCVAAAFISKEKGLIESDEYYEIRDMFVPFNLPISIEQIDIDEVIKISKSDKKMEQGRIKFILLKGIGHAVIDTTVKEDDLKAAMEEIIYKDDCE